MTQTFTACIRRLKDGSFLPYVDVVDAQRGMEWEELHPAGSVDDEAQARERATTLANELRVGEPVPSPGERYRRAHEPEPGSPSPATARGGIAAARLLTRLSVHEQLLSGDHHRAALAATA